MLAEARLLNRKSLENVGEAPAPTMEAPMYNDILFATTSLAFTELHALPVMAQNAHA